METGGHAASECKTCVCAHEFPVTWAMTSSCRRWVPPANLVSSSYGRGRYLTCMTRGMRSGMHENPAGEMRNLAREWYGIPSSAVQSDIAFQIGVSHHRPRPRGRHIAPLGHWPRRVGRSGLETALAQLITAHKSRLTAVGFFTSLGCLAGSCARGIARAFPEEDLRPDFSPRRPPRSQSQSR
jgi:hypothetical protein